MQVVLVDPSRAIQSAFTRLLEPRGHAVQAFSNPLAALARIRADAAVDALIYSAGVGGLNPSCGTNIIKSLGGNTPEDSARG